MSLTASSSLPADARFGLIIEVEGLLPLPETVARALSLKPKDIFSVERWPASLRLEPYEAFLEAIWRALPPGRLWNEVLGFFARPLAALEERGLPISPGLLPLHRGDEVILQVLSRGAYPEIYLYPVQLAAARRHLAIAER
jgi:hypothetical protein